MISELLHRLKNGRHKKEILSLDLSATNGR
jgi:hypothetical protein